MAHYEILSFPVKQCVAHGLKDILKLRSRGAAHFCIFYFPVKQWVAQYLKNILGMRSRGWPTLEYFTFLESRGWPMSREIY